jgi:hypothetical protein
VTAVFRPPLSAWAHDLAAELLSEELPRRWSHATAALEVARALLPIVPGDEELLLAAVVCHDIGYARKVKRTGYPSLDAAHHLRELQAPQRLADLGAHFINSRLEGELRGLGDEYALIPDEQTPTRDALWFCCLTVGPTGARTNFEDRMAEIRQRYGADPMVQKWSTDGYESLREAISRTRKRLSDASLTADPHPSTREI